MTSVLDARRRTVYWRLMRADRPIGTLLLLWPTVWALWTAAGGLPQWYVVLAFAAGTFFMRSAGCVINDYADRKIDGAVERTRNRPFAAGEVGSGEAFALLAVLCAAAAVCLLPLNRLTWLMSLPALFLAMTYPFTKRFFPLPQFYLGLAFSFGIPMAFAAVGNSVPPAAWLLFAANAAWTLAYDTAYAMADKEDDLRIGIRTAAITFGDRDVTAVMAFHLLFAALMAACGLVFGWKWPFWCALAYVFRHQLGQYFALARANRQDCFAVFLGNNRIGWVLAAGIALSYGAC